MSLCAGRTAELKGDLIRDERKVVTPRSPISSRPPIKILILQVPPIIFSARKCDIYGQSPKAKANIMSFHSAIHIVSPSRCLQWRINKVAAAVEWRWQSWLSKHSSGRLESGPWACREREGGRGRKGAVTLGWVIFDVHVKALTRGMWPACTLESGVQAALHWGQVVMQSQRVLLIHSHYVLVWCHTRMPPCRPGPTPPSLCRNDFSQWGKNPFTMCAL